MRRLPLTLAVLGLVALGLPLGARAAGTTHYAAAYFLGSPPSWMTTDEKNNVGTWVKHSSPVVANLGSSGRVILVGNPAGKLYALHYANHSLTSVWTKDLSSYIDSSPAVGDLDRDGCPEVMVGVNVKTANRSVAGVHVFDCHGTKEYFWPAPQGPQYDMIGVFATPAIGDITGDGKPDVAYGSYNSKIYVKDSSGRDLGGWPKQMDDTIWSSPALADINGDGRKEIVTGTDSGGGGSGKCARSARGTLAIFWADGVYVPNSPECVDTPIWSSPAVQDVNGDDHLDVIVGTNNYQENGNVGTSNVVRAWDTITGSLLWQTALGGQNQRVFSSPAVGDVGGDGALDVAIGTLASGADGSMFLLNARTGAIEWTKANDHSFGPGGFMGSPVMGDVTGDGEAEVVAATQNGTVIAWNRAGTRVVGPIRPDDRDGSRTWIFNNSPAVADADGDGKNEIVLAGGTSGSTPRKGYVWVMTTNGHDEGPWPFFRKTTDRIGSKGTGHGGRAAPPPPAPAPAPPPSGGSGSVTTPSATSVGATPTASAEATASFSATPTESTLALPSPGSTKRGSGRVALAILAGLLVASGAGLGVVGWRMHRGRSA